MTTTLQRVFLKDLKQAWLMNAFHQQTKMEAAAIVF
jgi:hypothetical protein